MSQENILDYLRKTPHNTNVNVVKGMIGGVGGSLPEVTEADDGKVLTVVNGQWSKAEGGGDVGYECTETKTTLTEESVTTTDNDSVIFGKLNYTNLIEADFITVTFNGTEYECPKVSDGEDVNNYGALFDKDSGSFDWSEYPFNIYSDGEGNIIGTETAGTYSIKIEAVEASIEISDCFKKAVVKSSGVFYIDGILTDLTVHDDTKEWDFGEYSIANVSADKTFAEIKQAYDSGLLCVFRANHSALSFDSSNLYPLQRISTNDGIVFGRSSALYMLVPNDSTRAVWRNDSISICIDQNDNVSARNVYAQHVGNSSGETL